MKKRRMKKLNNKGYSLVELIIVIAIIVVFSAAALVTMTVMHNAKAKEAATTFDSELSELIHNAKNRACDVNGDDKIVGIENDYTFGLRLYQIDGKCYLQSVLVFAGAYEANVDYEKANNPNNGLGKSLSTYVYVKYTDRAGNENVIGNTGNDEVLIYYNRDGSCASGVGTYEFMKTNNDTMVAIMTLNKNGSHQSN